MLAWQAWPGLAQRAGQTASPHRSRFCPGTARLQRKTIGMSTLILRQARPRTLNLLRMLTVICRGCVFGHRPDGGRVLEHQLEFRMRQSPNSARVPGRGWLARSFGETTTHTRRLTKYSTASKEYRPRPAVPAAVGETCSLMRKSISVPTEPLRSRAALGTASSTVNGILPNMTSQNRAMRS